jgi:choline dehydrogenase
VLKYFKQSETYLDGGDDTYRGHAGPLMVSRYGVRHELIDGFLAGAQAAGHKFNEDYNGAAQAGVAHTQVSIGNGLRSSTARAFLRRARRRPNVTVRTDAVVQRVLIGDGRATGVEIAVGSERVRVECAREVVLSAGSVWSPKLLLLSGIGPAAHLREHGIPVVQDSPRVGADLVEHIGASMIWRSRVPTLNTYFTPRRMLSTAYEWVVHRRGPIASAPSAVTVFGENGPSGLSEWQANFVPLATSSKIGSVAGMRLLDFPAMSAILKPLHPKPRGAVTLRSADPGDPPILRHELIGGAEDLRLLRLQSEALREIMATSAMRELVAEEVEPGPGVVSDNDWEDYFRSTTFRCKHPVGTCAMGPDHDAVVDPQLRVRGVDGLRIADASIMPAITSGNTNAPVVMIGEKASALVLGTD